MKGPFLPVLKLVNYLKGKKRLEVGNPNNNTHASYIIRVMGSLFIWGSQSDHTYKIQNKFKNVNVLPHGFIL